jgi:hypothetical protein
MPPESTHSILDGFAGSHDFGPRDCAGRHATPWNGCSGACGQPEDAKARTPRFHVGCGARRPILTDPERIQDSRHTSPNALVCSSDSVTRLDVGMLTQKDVLRPFLALSLVACVDPHPSIERMPSFSEPLGPETGRPQRAEVQVASARPIDVRMLLQECDRLVLARIASVREFDHHSLSPGEAAPARIRIAQLELIEAPFGLLSERLLVRVPEGTRLPESVALWPLGENRLSIEDNWDDFERISNDLNPDRIWMPVQGLDGPWPVRGSGAQREVQVSCTAIFITDHDLDPEPSAAGESAAEWIPLQQLEGALRSELDRIAPRVEAYVASNGPSSWSAFVDRDGTGVGPDGSSFQWNEEQRVRWDQAIARVEFSTLPRWLGTSHGPDEPLSVMSLVTREGRKTVTLQQDDPVAAPPEEVEALRRMRELWSLLQALVRTN